MKKLISLMAGLAFFTIPNIAFAQCANSNLSAWDLVQNPAGNLNVTAAAAMGGTTCGLAVTTSVQNTGAQKHYVQDNSPASEQRYRAAFCIDPNGVTMPTSGTYRRLKLHMAQCGNGAGCQNYDILQMKLQNVTAGDYSLKTFVRDLNTATAGNKKKFTIDIPDSGPSRIEYDLDLANGTLKVWVNATAESDPPAFNFTGLDLSAWAGVNQARLGFMDKGINITPGQTYYLDEFESRRQTFIGGTCN
jgi:hypothetical protein